MIPKTLILCHDTIGEKMAGPGIRYTYVAQTLSKVSDVTLAMQTDGLSKSKGGLLLISNKDDSFKGYFDKHDIIFAQWLSDKMIEYCLKSGKIIIFDLYAPVPIEYLASVEFSRVTISKQKDNEFHNIIHMYNRYIRGGEFFTVSNERQRNFWIGYATANGIIRPTTFAKNDLLKRFALAPMGISSSSPKVNQLKLRLELGLKKDDFVLLWTGGIWDWFDAQLIVRAISLIEDPHIKLVFLGTKHPNEIYKDEMAESLAARQLSEKLGLLDKSVFFLDGWVPYEDRAAYFLDADAAIYADKESLETRFSHRTRVLDHIWTELPTICSSGDFFSEVIQDYDFGLAVKQRTPEAFAEAIKNLNYDSKLYSRIKHSLHAKKNDFTWENTLNPLVEYVKGVDVDETSKRIKKSASSIRSKRKNITHRTKAAAKVFLGRV